MRSKLAPMLVVLLAMSLVVPFAPGAAMAAKKAAAKTEHAAGKATHAAAASAKVDINTASKEDLAKLPVIGDAIADKIVAGRPYKTKRDLLTKKILTEKQYAKVKDMLIAKQ